MNALRHVARRQGRRVVQQHQPSLAAASASAASPHAAAPSLSRSQVRHMGSDGPLEKTAFHAMHQELGGKMVPFAGYELPVLYEGPEGGVAKETLHTRADGCAGLFDVSHMGQIRWTGKDAVDFLETVVVGDIKGLKEGEGRLSLITNDEGGIKDDTVITNAGDYIYMVVNGACKHSDMEWFKKKMGAFSGDVHMEYLPQQQLLALQGTGAADIAKPFLPSDFNLEKMAFMSGKDMTFMGVEGCRLTRCGYTGEDGFEISMPWDASVDIARQLLENKAVKFTGLGARDALRLEAGLCLYGNDLDETTTPVEGVLTWTIGGPKARRRKEQGFSGASKILEADGKLKKVTRKRVGIKGMKVPARDGTEIYDAAGKNKIGVITSGTFSPCLKAPIAMGYVETVHAKATTDITVSVRGKMHKAAVTKMPFVESRYYRVPE